MRIMLDFKCTVCDHTDERYVDNTTEYTECSICNSKATRMISTPTISLEGYSGSFPGAAAAWEKKHRMVANTRD
jgi:hypothetical protein